MDALIERIIFAKNRDEQVAACKALDRVLLWNFYVVPQFVADFQRAARWDRFSHPEPLPKYGIAGFPNAVVVRRRQGRQDRQTQLKDLSRMALLSRRHVLGLGIGALSAARLRPALAADGGTEAHGMSVFGDLKYPADFQHFDYVNVDAPKGGVFSFIPSVRAYNQYFQTFNSLNAYILKGDGAQGMDMTFASLMVRASDEPDAMYGLAAKSGADLRRQADLPVYAAAGGAVSRRLEADRARCRLLADHAEDKGPSADPAADARHGEGRSARRRDAGRHLRREARARRPALCRGPADLLARPITRRGRSTNRRWIFRSGSGPYKVGKFEANRYIEFERVKDWWGADLPVSRGSYNFDIVRYEFYRDRDVAFEGFTGKNYLFREEFTARVWATRYDFPAVKDGRVKLRSPARRHAVGRAGLVHQYARATSSRIRACARR